MSGKRGQQISRGSTVLRFEKMRSRQATSCFPRGQTWWGALLFLSPFFDSRKARYPWFHCLGLMAPFVSGDLGEMLADDGVEAANGDFLLASALTADV